MASEPDFVEFVVEQMEDAGAITFRKMFGEYAVYCNSKVVALVCDNRLFVKPTSAGRSFIGDVVEAPPYPGAKMYFAIEDKIEDREWISHLVKITEEELPEPKPKKKKRKKVRGSRNKMLIEKSMKYGGHQDENCCSKWKSQGYSKCYTAVCPLYPEGVSAA